ncbi:MAG: hypothetical protein GY722_06050, partial [bacterium]|nr:hypothetical protein [bacterium]
MVCLEEITHLGVGGLDLQAVGPELGAGLEQGVPQHRLQVLGAQPRADPLGLAQQGDRLAGVATLEAEALEVGSEVVAGDDPAQAGESLAEEAQLVVAVLEQGGALLVLVDRQGVELDRLSADCGRNGISLSSSRASNETLDRMGPGSSLPSSDGG